MRTLISAAQEGIGIISFSKESELLQDSGLINVLPDLYGPKIDSYLVTLKDEYKTPAVREFEKFLQNEASVFYEQQ